jgi:hypothetical protein
VYIAHLYDVQCNAASSNLDIRTVQRAGFKVDNKSSSGFKLGDRDDSELSESTDTAKSMMSLAAASVRNPMDLFVTYTNSQRSHPGTCHFYIWKESFLWSVYVPLYDTLSYEERQDVHDSFEMAYTHVLSRAWMEVQKIWINLIMRTKTSMLPEVKSALFRKEFQEDVGNLSHLHALLCFEKGGRNSKEFMEFLGNLQKNSVIDLNDYELMEKFIDEGLVRDETDWSDVIETGRTVLPHNCYSNSRCLIQVGPDPVEDVRCKKQHPVRGRADPVSNEWRKIPVKFSAAALDVLAKTGHYIPPNSENPEGSFTHVMFDPRRHFGPCNPSATCNMSPVLAEHFAVTRSMQNMQIVCGTNGVTRYVVKVRICCMVSILIKVT